MEMYSDNNGIKHMYNAEGKLSSASTYNSSTGDRTNTNYDKNEIVIDSGFKGFQL